jgi:hypothetical protein
MNMMTSFSGAIMPLSGGFVGGDAGAVDGFSTCFGALEGLSPCAGAGGGFAVVAAGLSPAFGSTGGSFVAGGGPLDPAGLGGGGGFGAFSFDAAIRPPDKKKTGARG